MTQNEMIENISKKCNVSPEEAKAALEAGNWNVLIAAQGLEQEKLRRMQEVEAVATACAVQAAPEAPAAEAVETAEATETVEVAAEANEASGEPAAKVEPAADEKAAKGEKASRAFKSIGQHIRRLLALGNRNRFEVRRNGETLLHMPVTALALLLIFSFGTCAFLMVVGLFAGCRYSIGEQGDAARSAV